MANRSSKHIFHDVTTYNFKFLPLRKNMYDGIPEYWVVVKETGKRTESQSFEEFQQKQSKAPIIESLLSPSIFQFHVVGLQIRNQ